MGKETATVKNAENSDDIPLKLCQNLLDMEAQASRVLSERAFTYFHSAADSLSALQANKRDWSRVSFRPRVLRNVAHADMTCRVMGQTSILPIFIAPMAMIKLADKEGELALARAGGSQGIPYAVSTYSSCSHEEIMQCVDAEGIPQSQTFQLYVARKREKAMELIRKARQLRFKALLVTVDTPVVGKREEDDRYKARVEYQSGVEDTPRTRDISDPEEQPVLRGVHSSTLNWGDLTWIRETWQDGGPIILKGIQSAEDALLAYKSGVDGIYLSNHGGRQLDFAPSALQTLLEIRKFCPAIIGKFDIYLDGGVRRGSDVLKAICLGATAVGLGRPFVYALGAYGRQGVERAIERKYSPQTHSHSSNPNPVLSDEIETTMRLLGVNKLTDLSPRYVNTKELEHYIVDGTDRKSLQEEAKARL
jgi:L-lactate dehydrogenase (cytochrome)